MSTRDKLKEIIRELIRKELEEVSVTGNLDGGAGPPKTPYAFSGGRKKDKEKKKSIKEKILPEKKKNLPVTPPKKEKPKKDSIKEKIVPKKKKDRLEELRKELG